MGKKAVTVLPATLDILIKMGEQIKLARLRRNLTTQLVAERAGISRATLWKIEAGDPSVAMGMYAAVSVDLTAERAGISRATLWKVEKGDPSVAIGIYASVLHALNDMDKDLLLVAQNDPLGRTLQDLNLPIRKRAPKGE